MPPPPQPGLYPTTLMGLVIYKWWKNLIFCSFKWHKTPINLDLPHFCTLVPKIHIFYLFHGQGLTEIGWKKIPSLFIWNIVYFELSLYRYVFLKWRWGYQSFWNFCLKLPIGNLLNQSTFSSKAIMFPQNKMRKMYFNSVIANQALILQIYERTVKFLTFLAKTVQNSL